MAKNKEEKKENDTFLIFLIIILVIIALILLAFKIISGKSIDPESKIVTSLHNYFSTEDLGNCEGLFSYTDGVVESKDVKEENKICLAYHKADIEKVDDKTYKAKEKDGLCETDGMTFKTEEGTKECQVSIYPREEVEKLYVEMFGDSVSDDLKSFKIDGSHICFLKDNQYYCGLSDEVTYTVGSNISVYRGIKKANQKKDEIIIYDYFIKLIGEKCYTSYVNGKENTSCSNAYSNLDAKKIDFAFIKKYGTIFKHTYKKGNDDNYYWIKSEKI